MYGQFNQSTWVWKISGQAELLPSEYVVALKHDKHPIRIYIEFSRSIRFSTCASMRLTSSPLA